MPRYFKQKAVVLALVGFTGATAAPLARAIGCPPYNDTFVIAQTMALEAAMKGLWTWLFNQLSSTLLGYDRKELGAIKVLTSQISTAARAEINAKQALVKGKMSALGLLTSSQEQLRIFQKYSVQTGQGVDPCGQLSAQTLVQISSGLSRQAARNWVRLAPSAPGRYGDPGGYYNTRMAIRVKNFATKDDEAMGFGKATTETVTLSNGVKFPLAGADANGQVLFADSSDERVALAKQQFINNLAGPPIAPLPASLAMTPAAREFQVKKNRRDAMMSAATYSLQQVAADNTPIGKDGVSKMEALRRERDQYFGQAAAQRWAAWMTQDIRGLRLDSMRMDAASLAAKQQQYESGQRIELMLGLLVADKGREMGQVMRSQFGDARDATNAAPLR